MLRSSKYCRPLSPVPWLGKFAQGCLQAHLRVGSKSRPWGSLRAPSGAPGRPGPLETTDIPPTPTPTPHGQRSRSFWPTRRSPSTRLRLRTTSTWQSPGAVQAPRARSWQVPGGPRGRAVPLDEGWQAGTRPLGTAAARAPDGEHQHEPPSAPGARRSDHSPARHSPAGPPGPPGLCFHEPDRSRHFGVDLPRAPSRPRTLLGGQGPGGDDRRDGGGSLGAAGAPGREARTTRRGGGEQAPPAQIDCAPGRRAGPPLGESCSPPLAHAPPPAGRPDPQDPRAGRRPPPASFPKAPLPGHPAPEGRSAPLLQAHKR